MYLEEAASYLWNEKEKKGGGGRVNKRVQPLAAEQCMEYLIAPPSRQFLVLRCNTNIVYVGKL